MCVRTLSSFKRKKIRTRGLRGKLGNLIRWVYIEKYFHSGRPFGRYGRKTGHRSKKSAKKRRFLAVFVQIESVNDKLET